MNKRHLYIDNLRGILILLVILGHCIQFLYADFDHNLAFKYIYAFHMPLFMFISGFVGFLQKSGFQVIKKRFCQLIIPFTAWSVILYFINGNKTGGQVFDYFLHPDWSLWFLWVLFFIILIFMSIETLCNKFKLNITVSLGFTTIILMGIMLKFKFKEFGFQFIAWYFSFYAFGYLYHKYEDKLGNFINKTKWITFALFIITAYFWMRKEAPTFMQSNNQIYTYIYKYIVALIGISTFMPLAKSYIDKPLKLTSRIGRSMTLGIYSMQQIIIVTVCRYCSFIHEINLFIAIILLFMTTTALSFWFNVILGKNRFVSYVLLGLKRNK